MNDVLAEFVFSPLTSFFQLPNIMIRSVREACGRVSNLQAKGLKMSQNHIRSIFDRELDAVQALVMRMGGLVEVALLQAADALDRRDEDLALRVRAGDKAIDELEARIHSECARILALRAPTASDLRLVLSVIRIASALERCGDYAKNLAKRSKVLSELAPLGTSSASVSRMTQTVVQRLRQALESYERRDGAVALKIRAADREIDQMYNSLFRELLTYMIENPRNITAAMHLQFIAKNIERVGDHATRIAEQVLYLTTGENFPDDRPKEDASGF